MQPSSFFSTSPFLGARKEVKSEERGTMIERIGLEWNGERMEEEQGKKMR